MTADAALQVTSRVLLPPAVSCPAWPWCAGAPGASGRPCPACWRREAAGWWCSPGMELLLGPQLRPCLEVQCEVHSVYSLDCVVSLSCMCFSPQPTTWLSAATSPRSRRCRGPSRASRRTVGTSLILSTLQASTGVCPIHVAMILVCTDL